MAQDPQAWNKQDETIGVPTGQFYVRAVGTGIGTVPRTENVGTIPTGQFYTPSTGSIGGDIPTPGNNTTPQPQTDKQPANKGLNNNLTKLLVGGLVGATLGTLASALANKRTAQGANHAAKGLGKAVKSVGEGVNHAAKGVGEAVKTVTEGVNHAVVGSVVDALKDTAESAKQSVESVKDKIGQTGNYVNPDNQQPQPETTYVLIPVEKERVIERTIIVESDLESTMPEVPDVSDFTSDSVTDQMPVDGQPSEFNQQPSEFNQQTSELNEPRPDFLG